MRRLAFWYPSRICWRGRGKEDVGRHEHTKKDNLAPPNVEMFSVKSQPETAGAIWNGDYYPVREPLSLYTCYHEENVLLVKSRDASLLVAYETKHWLTKLNIFYIAYGR